MAYYAITYVLEMLCSGKMLQYNKILDCSMHECTHGLRFHVFTWASVIVLILIYGSHTFVLY